MGSTYGICCKECNYRKSFKIGIGMMFSPQNIMDLKSEFAMLPRLIQSKKTIDEIEELFNNKGTVLASDYGYEIYHCQKCGEFFERFFIRLEFDDYTFEVEYKCPKCKINLKQIKYEVQVLDGSKVKKINLNRYPCPKCGKNGLYQDSTAMMFWD